MPRLDGLRFSTTPPRWQARVMWRHVAIVREGSLPRLRTGPPRG